MNPMRRREFVATLAAGTAAAQAPVAEIERKGRLKQCVTRGVFAASMPFEETCKQAARLGCKGYDLIGPNDWPMLKKYGLLPTMYPPGPGGTIPDALNRTENHARIEASIRTAIDASAAIGAPNVITFSGNRRGMSDAEGADNCVAFSIALNRMQRTRVSPSAWNCLIAR